jgi:RHS repeat-associated protein
VRITITRPHQGIPSLSPEVSSQTCAAVYSFGFNGKENDDDVHGATGTFQDYGMRAFDTRLARFFTIDPIAFRFPMLTPYQFASNSPIQAIDLDGQERFHYLLITDNKGQSTIQLAGVEDIVDGGFFTKLGLETLDNQLGTQERINEREEHIIHNFYSTIGLWGIESHEKTAEYGSAQEALAGAQKGDVNFSDADKLGCWIESGFGMVLPESKVAKEAEAGFKVVSTLSKVRNLWKLTVAGAESVKYHRKWGTFFKSAADGTWWAVDKAAHGGSRFKVFREGEKGLEWISDADQYGTYIEGKHKSVAGTFIPWSELGTSK